MSKTKIEWTDKTWNPFTGCTKTSPGCDNCYASKMSKRLKGRAGYPEDQPFRPTFHPNRLDQPLKWKKPCKIFVCSMADLFHKDNSFEQIAAVFGLMAATPQHTFQILTKRPERMQKFYEWLGNKSIEDRPLLLQIQDYLDSILFEFDPDGNYQPYWHLRQETWPLSNLIHGVTGENQEQIDKRLSILLGLKVNGHILKTYVSIEPMLGEIKFDPLMLNCPICNGRGWYVSNPFFTTTHPPKTRCKVCEELAEGFGMKPPKTNEYLNSEGRGLDWVIVGGETGHKARPMHPDWVRSIRDQCKETGTPFFFKQMSGRNKNERPPTPKDLLIREFP